MVRELLLVTKLLLFVITIVARV